MNNDLNNISAKRYMLIRNILDSSENKKFYNEMDALLLKKYFDNAYETSLLEDMYRINSSDISNKIIFNFLDNFELSVKNGTILKTRHLFELVKISSLPTSKLKKTFTSEICKKIAILLTDVSHETILISNDFLILRVSDNLILNNESDKDIVKDFSILKNSILKKMSSFSYSKESREKENTYLCWIDMILQKVIVKELSVTNFIQICEQIFSLTTHTVYLYWKILNSINYLLLQRDYSAHANLRKYKTEIEKIIEQKYINAQISIDELKNLLLTTLAKQQILKEDYYYLFDMMDIIVRSSCENKLFCLNLCEYLLYNNTKRFIFNYRFIRKYFIDIFLSWPKEKDTLPIKEKELHILINLLHTDVFFCFDRHRIVRAILYILKSINNNTCQLTHGNFYKYCEIIDYIMAKNPDLCFPNIIDFLSANNDNKQKIAKRFKLTKI